MQYLVGNNIASIGSNISAIDLPTVLYILHINSMHQCSKLFFLPFLPMFLSHHKHTQRHLHLHRSSLPVCRLHHHFQGQGCNKHVYDNANKYHHKSSFSSPLHMIVCYRDTDCKNCSYTGVALLSTILLSKYAYVI